MSPPTLGLSSSLKVAGWWEWLRSRDDLLTIPDQLGTWGAMVDQRKYVGESHEQLPLLATRLHMLGHRLHELFEARRNPQAQFLVEELSESIRDWRLKLQETFQLLSEDPAGVNQNRLRSGLDMRLEQLEERIIEAMDKADEGQISGRDSENFYRLLGAYRGVSDAAVAYVGIAVAINWSPWHEERF